MSEIIDLDAHRTKPPDRCILSCACGCGMFRMFDDGAVECLNCGGVAQNLRGHFSEDDVSPAF